MTTPDLPSGTTRELLRARMAHLTTAQAAAIAAGTRRARARQVLQEEERFRDPVRAEEARAALAAARAKEDAALDELGRAFVAAVRFVSQLP